MIEIHYTEQKKVRHKNMYTVWLHLCKILEERK